MKQHITREQFNELSDKGKDRLREWWEPNYGDRYTMIELKVNGKPRKNQKLYEFTVYEDDEYGWKDPKEYCEYWITYPLLSIGQMIEFLDEEQEKGSEVVTWIMLSKGSHSWSVGTFGNTFMGNNGINTECPELCDALWDCVKEVLEMEV